MGWLSDAERDQLAFVAAVGGTRGTDRLCIHRYLSARGLESLSLVHPTAWGDSTARLGEGSQILAMAGVSVGSVLGDQCIVNTNATVDHDCRLGDGVHIMPGATLAGEVIVEDQATIGTNATVLPRMRIGKGAVVGAGAVVTQDVPAWTTVAGNPAKPIGTTIESRPLSDPWLK